MARKLAPENTDPSTAAPPFEWRAQSACLHRPGATVRDGGVNISLFSDHQDTVLVASFDREKHRRKR
jgi:hypothetical protein